MDAVILARIQFALTIGFHYIFPPLTIGMAWVITWMLWKYVRTGKKLYDLMADFWIKVFAVSFAIGVATGITMEFQFGTNWADYSRFVGDIFGAPLAAEGILAFFLESSFLGVLLLGKRRVSKKFYFFSSLMVAFGSTLSAFWIIVANSWQQTPTGFHLVNGRAELTDFSAAVFNPSTIPRYLHSIDGALIAGAFFVMGISAWYLLKNRHLDFAKESLKIALIIGFAAALFQWPIGHGHAVQVAETQPVKLAAFEGLWETTDNAPLLIFGLPNVEEERTDFALAIPGALSIGVGGSSDTVVKGLKDFPKDDRPPIWLTFSTFHLMVGMGAYFLLLTAYGLFLMWRKKLYTDKLFLKLALYSIPLPIIANELGWIAAEVGRQPWIVYNIMRTKDAISTVVPAWQILFSIILFSVVYALLFFVWIFVLKLKIKHGPEEIEDKAAGAELSEKEVSA